jgi:aldose 1-epimerase
MEAVPDQDTVINMTHHSYVNLAGHASGDILGQRLRIAADHYIPVEGDLLPTGELLPVAGTPFDFRELATIGERMEALFGGSGGKGFDHNWCVRRTASGPGLVEVLEAVDPVSRRRMRAWTSEPGLQVYMGGYLGSAVIGKGGSPYCAFAGFTLEGQKFPDSPNQPQFPSPVVRAGDVYRQDMVLEFDTV